MMEWMSKIAETDLKDWNSEAPPETDMEGFYNTSLPVFLFKMTDQNLQVCPPRQERRSNYRLAAGSSFGWRT
ncbi:hypothetical protein OS493_032457 [Desmophyllum pertusum]|uniref:Uncharacterized protein n=1 Tax=Desmophyllum pertusum TaxID=174260 RepID=A0A9W9ZX06_9CNID|nr:hypothetical protein OS493_032457 [Desmophyllum pertusum]